MKIAFSSILIFLHVIASFAQHQPSSSEIKLKIRKLNFLGSVMYVAAHPDDENTRAIAYLANDKLATTAYLSMTRGDGGQNLIGPEIRDLLGLIRTQELLAARRIDGGEQFFTRANDFGFSKNYKETFEIWNKDEILSDVVRIMRQFKPDVILTRFPPDERAGHGHHTASAILAQEAFDIINDANVFPEQAKEFGTWKASAIYTNTGRWWNQSINENTPGILSMNVGTYNTLLGKSYSEIAAESRTQHKSQGFGSPGRRGDAWEFFEFAKGDKAHKDLFEKINTTWSRVKGGEKIQSMIDNVLAEYSDEFPSKSIPALITVYKEIYKLDPSVWRTRKLNDTEQIIRDCLGLYFEATGNFYWSSPDQPVTINFELINRSDLPLNVQRIKINDMNFDSTLNMALKNNALINFKTSKTVNDLKEYSSPYWLKEPHSQGLFTVKDEKLIGKPENDPAINIQIDYNVLGEVFSASVPLIYKWTDPVKGELSRPFEVVPPIFVNFLQPVFIFNDNSSRTLSLQIKSASNKSLNGKLKLTLPSNWKSEPEEIPFLLSRQGDELLVKFNVTPSQADFEGDIKAVALLNGSEYSKSLVSIQYDHIPIQTLLPPARAKVVKMQIRKEGAIVGYIKGAGDEIPDALRNLGYEVWEMKNEEITPENLKRLDAVVLGIRALNTNERIQYIMPQLLNYVKGGGTMVVQYNTTNDLELDKDKFSPYPITLSRERVTEEESEVRILNPDHPVLNTPNKIIQADFSGWVQERGLYFPSSWDANYEAILSMNDKGEPERKGSLLVAKYGEGHYVYSGLSFFRELPEGVSGAYKLFSNIVSLGKTQKPTSAKIKVKK
jgi:LmbE family N-acetylglucosaminyl deacetylase